jgi:putative SOS response-associated peptidase YedK
MPLILEHGDVSKWLSHDIDGNPESIKKFFYQFLETKMQAYPISKLITSRKENSNVPDITKPFDFPELLSEKEVKFN